MEKGPKVEKKTIDKVDRKFTFKTPVTSCANCLAAAKKDEVFHVAKENDAEYDKRT